MNKELFIFSAEDVERGIAATLAARAQGRDAEALTPDNGCDPLRPPPHPARELARVTVFRPEHVGPARAVYDAQLAAAGGQVVCVAPLAPPEILEAMAATFRERSRTYGDNYKRFGAVFLGMFPDGRIPEITRQGDADRLQLLMQIVNKCTRYAQQLTRGGHKDSARDIGVYAAMLEEMTDER